jgi:hypothetical protein
MLLCLFLLAMLPVHFGSMVAHTTLKDVATMPKQPDKRKQLRFTPTSARSQQRFLEGGASSLVDALFRRTPVLHPKASAPERLFVEGYLNLCF